MKINYNSTNHLFVAAFEWPHEAILLLIDEYEKRQYDFISEKISQKKLWIEISGQLRAYGNNITGPQCQSKFSGLKKTYKKSLRSQQWIWKFC